MKAYESPTLEVLHCTVDTALAAVVQSEPTVEDDDLSV